MLTNYTKNINVNATSSIEDEILLNLRATINEDGTFHISQNIRNVDLYFSNKETCDADFKEFEAKVYELLNK